MPFLDWLAVFHGTAALAFARVLAGATVIAGFAAALALHEFLPLQSCVSPFFSSAIVPGLVLMFDLPDWPLVAALKVETAPPDMMPATAAPARRALVL
ncbi:MAG: hypothetical protein H0X73_13280 [Chthoniobacterales bacterium]|nr:hypothetical protein [Chthoniobacterales bacterium]